MSVVEENTKKMTEINTFIDNLISAFNKYENDKLNEQIRILVDANPEYSTELVCLYTEDCGKNQVVDIINLKSYITNTTKPKLIDDIYSKVKVGGKRKVKKSRKRKSYLKSGKRPKRRGSKTRRIMYGGSGALDSFQSYSASSLNPGWAISGVNNFSGPTHVAIESRPSGMV